MYAASTEQCQTLSVEEPECPVCGPAPFLLWMRGNNRTAYVRCHKCRTIYARPRLPERERFEAIQDDSAAELDIFSNGEARRAALREQAAVIHKYVGRGRMLDVGCSTGIFFDFFQPSQWDRCGIELSRTAAEVVAERPGVTVYSEPLETVAFADASFDLVAIIDTLYHIPSPDSLFREVGRILKPGGFVAIELAGQAYQLMRSRGLACWLFDRKWTRLRSDGIHLHFLPPNGLNQLLVSNRLTPICWHVIGSPSQRSALRTKLSAAHKALMSGLASYSFQTLNWAPKYLCLAQLR